MCQHLLAYVQLPTLERRIEGVVSVGVPADLTQFHEPEKIRSTLLRCDRSPNEISSLHCIDRFPVSSSPSFFLLGSFVHDHTLTPE